MEVGIFSVVQQGDIGGKGVSRFAIMNSAGTQWSNTELNAGAAAISAIYTAIKASLPPGMTFAMQPTMTLVEATTGALVAVQNIPTITVVSGTGSGSYVGGTGARMYWHTNTLKGRRMVRGATYMTPLTNVAFTSSGALQPTTQTSLITAGGTYISTLVTATLQPVVLCRPTTKGGVNGLEAPIISCGVGSQPASVRSRRS